MRAFSRIERLCTAVALTAALMCAGSGSAATCIGNCGHGDGTQDGSVTPAPGNSGQYDWVSTNLGVFGAARIEGYDGSATNGSELTSDPFYATAGQTVSFNFNYVTSDGAQYADYAFAQLINTTSGLVHQLFNARTTQVGDIVPGSDLPPVEATLSPASVQIIPGAPQWSPLGGSSGLCFSTGCGYTGWIGSAFTVPEAGTYQLRFGAANWVDDAYDSGLAFSGLLLDSATIGDGSSADNPLLPGTIGPNGEFQFEFTATPNQFVFVDPLVASGYDFEVLSGQLITSALFPELGDLDGYEIYSLLDLTNPLATGVMGGAAFDFGAGISGFALRGIDPALGLDPTNPTAFVTGLAFDQGGTVSLTQTPVTTFVAAVPEASVWTMMIFGVGAVGAMLRRRRPERRTFALAQA
jgi:hypothetical protein